MRVLWPLEETWLLEDAAEWPVRHLRVLPATRLLHKVEANFTWEMLDIGIELS